MRILMLGWEFPPFISGGLGTACHGLTRALDRLGHEVIFVLPRPVERSHASHVTLLTPDPNAPEGGVAYRVDAPGRTGVIRAGGAGRVEFRAVDAAFSSPYPGFAEEGPRTITLAALTESGVVPVPGVGASSPVGMAFGAGSSAGAAYGNDLVGDSERYARLVVGLARAEQFDVVHGHDWLTYPAALAVARIAGKPLVVHVHSTEFDRSGTNVNQRVYDIERAGMRGADRVVAVSELTKSICVSRYGVPPEKVDVVYNGVEREGAQPPAGAGIESGDKIVLFLGRITMQKGPEYFIAAARRVLEKIPNVKFVVAGSGDMALRMVELAANMGLGRKVLFTGFLRGRDVERVFALADCYVMPSVSEPFGIAALEAMRHDVPVIVSKTSGVAEVVRNVLKVDFWDIDEMANKIVAVLRHPSLRQTMAEHGAMELRRLTWDGAAKKCVESYEAAIRQARE